MKLIINEASFHYQSTNQPINQSTNQPINQSTNQPINPLRLRSGRELTN